MSHDPLITALMVGIKEKCEMLRDSLENNNFDDLARVCLIQGRLQGLRMAHDIIDDTIKAIDEG